VADAQIVAMQHELCDLPCDTLDLGRQQLNASVDKRVKSVDFGCAVVANGWMLCVLRLFNWKHVH